MHRPEQDRGETDWSQVNHSTALCNWYVISISVANLERIIIACGFDVASIFDGERKWCKYNDGSSGKLDKGFRMKQTLLVDST